MKKLLIFLLIPITLFGQNFRHNSPGLSSASDYSTGTLETDTLRTRYIRLLDGLNSDSIASFIYFDGDTSRWVGDPIKIGNNSIIVKDDTVKISNAMLTVSGQVQADTLVPYHNSTIYIRHFTADTIEVIKYFHQQEIGIVDSLMWFASDGDTLKIDPSVGANVLEYEDENVTVAKLDSAGNWTAQQITSESTMNVGAGSGSGSNLNVNETLGTELITGATAMSTWTPTTNWTYGSSVWTHATGDATALTSNWSPTAGVNYQIIYTITQTVAGSGVMLSAGGVSLPASTAAGTYTYYVPASSTTALKFTPGTGGTWEGSITSVSVKAITNGDIAFVDGTFKGQMLGPTGNPTYPTYGFRGSAGAGMYFRPASGSNNNLVGISTPEGEVCAATSVGFYVTGTTRFLALRSGDAPVYSDAIRQWDFRSSVNPYVVNVYGTYTSATNYERAFLRSTATAGEIGTEKGSGGGTARPLNFYTDGTIRGSISATGITAFADTLRAPRITATGGLRIGPQSSESITNIDTVKTAGGVVRWIKHTTGDVVLWTKAVQDTTAW